MNIKNSALLLIEFQNEWLSSNGKLHYLFDDKQQFLSSVENAKKVLEAARASKMNIAHSGLSFTNSYQELGMSEHGLRFVKKIKLF